MTANTSSIQRGLVSSEMIVAGVVLVVFFVVVVRMLGVRQESTEFGARAAQAVAVDQRILDEIQGELTGATLIYENDAVGKALLAKLDLPEDARPIPYTRLPRLMGGVDEFHREMTSGARTGNALLFAAHSEVKRIQCDGVDGDPAAPRDLEVVREYKIDVYRLVCYYLTAVGEGPRPGANGGLDLCRFVSQMLADAAQIESIEYDKDRATVLRKLVGEEVTGAWRRDVVGPPGWYRIHPSSAILESVERIPPDPLRSSWGMLEGALQVASIHAPESLGVGQLGVKTDIDGGFPHGFELQLAGTGSMRQMMVHLTVVSTGAGAPVSADIRNVIVVRAK